MTGERLPAAGSLVARLGLGGLDVFAGRRLYYGWVVVGVALLSVAAGHGARAAFSVLLVALLDAFGWGRALTAAIISVNAIASAACAVPTGLLNDRLGAQRVTVGAAVLVGTGFALAALASEAWH